MEVKYIDRLALNEDYVEDICYFLNEVFFFFTKEETKFKKITNLFMFCGI